MGEETTHLLNSLQNLPAPRVLIVEDDDTDAELLGLILRQLGCDTERAKTSDDGLAAAKSGVSMVFLDLRLPGKASWMDIVQECGAVPVVIFSGHINYSEFSKPGWGQLSLVEKNQLSLDTIWKVLKAHKIKIKES